MLQPKYAKQLDSNIKELLANGGSNEDVEKMASDYTSLFSDEALKKKDNSDVTAQTQKSVSETSTGFSDGVGSNGFPAIDQNLGVPGLKPNLKTVEQLVNPPKSKATIQAEQNNALKYEKFKQFSALTDEIKKENAQKVEDEANGVGFLNNVVSFGKETYNTAIEGASNALMIPELKNLKANPEPLYDEKKEAKDLMIKQGVNPKDINSNSVLELAKKIKLQKLNDSDIESRKKDFLSDTNIDFEDLQKGANLELSKISNKDKELLKQKAVLEPVLKDSDNRLNELNQQLANFKKNNQQPTPEFVDEYNYAIKYHNDIIKDVQKADNQFADNRDKIGDLKTNLDLFKRQYGKVNNFVSNIGATALDLAAGGFGIVDYGFNAAYGALGVDTGPKESSEIVTGLRGASKKIRDRIAKPINIDNIEDVGDFGDWMANTVIANQIPIYGLIATGAGGIVALGGSSLGTKYGDMVQEMNPDNPVEGQILKNYSNAELAWKPVGFGIAETASALVDAHIMKGAARVLASATQPERRLISQTVARKLLDVGGQTVKGGVYESTDEMATQGVENLIDGKPFTEGMKDAGGAGGAMGALIPFFAGNIAIAAKPFSIDNKIQNSAKRTLALEKELANPSLSEDAKKIIQTNFEESKKTTENLLKKQVKDISKMSNENFQEVLRIENEQAKLKEKAIEIKTQEGLSKDIKKQLLSDFSARFNEIEVDRIDILSGKKTMPKIEEDAKVEIPITETEVKTEVQEPTNKQKVDEARIKRRVENKNLTQAKGSAWFDSADMRNAKIGDEVHFSDNKSDNDYKTKVKDIVDGKIIFENGKTFDDVSSGINVTAEDAWFDKNHPELTLKPEIVTEQATQEVTTNEQKVEQDDFRLSFNDSQEVTDEKIRKSNIKAKVEQLRVDEQVENAEIEKKYAAEIQKVKDTSPEEQGYSGFNDAADKINAKKEAELGATYTKYDKLITPLLKTETKPTSTTNGDVAENIDKKQPTNAKEWEEQNFSKEEIDERRKFGLTPEQEWEPTFRGTTLSEWEKIQNGDDFKSEGLNELVFTTPSKELAKQSGKGVDAEVIIEFKPESKSKMREGDAKYDSKEYYGNGLNKEDVLRVTDKNGNVIYEATSTKIGDVTTEVVAEKPTTTTEDSTANKFEKSLTLLKEIDSKQGVDARNAKRERNEFLKDNPTIKYIDDNYKNIVKQLEKQGLFKQLKDC